MKEFGQSQRSMRLKWSLGDMGDPLDLQGERPGNWVISLATTGGWLPLSGSGGRDGLGSLGGNCRGTLPHVFWRHTINLKQESAMQGNTLLQELFMDRINGWKMAR